jgi:hypothetical protein
MFFSVIFLLPAFLLPVALPAFFSFSSHQQNEISNLVSRRLTFLRVCKKTSTSQKPGVKRKVSAAKNEAFWTNKPDKCKSCQSGGSPPTPLSLDETVSGGGVLNYEPHCDALYMCPEYWSHV